MKNEGVTFGVRFCLMPQKTDTRYMMLDTRYLRRQILDAGFWIPDKQKKDRYWIP
jgi:hypothetical protein